MPSPIDLRDPAAVAARRPLRIAHRGGVVGPGAPENSLAAIERAAAAPPRRGVPSAVRADDSRPVA